MEENNIHDLIKQIEQLKQENNLLKDKVDFLLSEKYNESEFISDQMGKIHQNFFSKSFDGIVVVQNERILMSNQVLLKIIHKSASEAINTTFVDYIHPDDRQIVMDRYNKRIAGEKLIEEYKIRLLNPNYGISWVILRPVLITWNNAPALLVFLKDISSQLLIERELKAVESNFESLFEFMSDGIIQLKYNDDLLTFEIKEINTRAEQIENINRADFIGKDIKELYIDIQFDFLYENIQKVHATGSPVRINEKKISNNWRKYFIYKSATDDIVILFNDITSYVVIKQEYLEKQSELNYHVNFLNAIFNLVPFPIFVKNKEGQYIKCNDAFCELFGKSISDLIGKSVFDISDIADAEKFTEKDREIVRTHKQFYEGTVKTPQGILKSFMFYKSVILDNNGNYDGIIGIMVDITEMKHFEEALINAKEKAEEADKLKTAFLANMSHEIRTPMNGIIGFSELLKDDSISKTERQEYLNYITSCSNSLLNLIDEIIDISKIEAKQISIIKAEFRVDALMNELLAFMLEEKNRRDRNDIEIKLKNEALGISVYSDSNRLRQIISNLLINALKFTRQGFIEFGYMLQSEKDILFYVKDTGVGIPEDKFEIIFDRFSQIDNNVSKSERGAGLGLAISKSLVNLLGGKIWIESVVGKGSTFYFTIPYTTTLVKSRDEIIYDQNKTSVLFNWSDKNVLIAEDDDINYTFIKEALRKTHCKLYRAVDGEQAINLIKNQDNIDIVLLDIQMPKLDGLKVLELAKKIKPEIPIIVQTAYAMQEERNKCFNAGCQQYISKPFEVAKLLTEMSRFI